MVITCKDKGNSDVKKIEVEGDKGKEVIVHYGIVPRNGKRGIMKIFHGNGTSLISPRKGNKPR
jgi:hypothetical protein